LDPIAKTRRRGRLPGARHRDRHILWRRQRRHLQPQL